MWGLSFPTMKSALQYVSPFELLAMRNVVGLLALVVIWAPGIRRRRGDEGAELREGAGSVDEGGTGARRQPLLDRQTTGAGVLLGLALASGLALQVVGLQTTTSVKAGFITGLYVIFTPFVAIPILRRFPAGAVIVAAAMATAGLFLLTVGGLENLASVAPGDVLNIGAAVAFALHVALTGRYAPRLDYRRLCLVEASVKAAVFSFALARIDPEVIFVRQVAVAVVVTGLGATALGLAVQTWAQTRISASSTAVILASEPAFAGLFGFVILEEALSPRAMVGAAIMLGAIVMAARFSGEEVVGTPT